MEGVNTCAESVQGQQLLVHLAEFIQQIIQPKTFSEDTKGQKDGSAAHLPKDVLQNNGLLGALEKFVRAVSVDPEPPLVPKILSQDESKDPDPKMILSSGNLPLKSRLPEELWGACDTATRNLQSHVFNNMPIRLLRFDSNGNGVHLVDRHEAFQYIMNCPRHELDEIISTLDKVKSSSTDSFDLPDAECLFLLEGYCRSRARYAILSHTWIRDVPGDVVYSDWEKRQLNPRGLQKITKFCQVAAQNHGVTLAWMDTVCINKDSSSELDESIRSMYRWYQNAHVCVAYLSQRAEELRLCRRNEAFRIPISRKMEMASRRSVTRAEDAVYSLMGLLGVEISIAYGEGQQHALHRVIRELLSTQKNILDAFNCRPGSRGLIPSDLSVYQERTRIFDNTEGIFQASLLEKWPPLEPVMVTHLGVRISLLLVPGLWRGSSGPATSPRGGYWGSVELEDRWYGSNDGSPPLVLPTRCDLLSSSIYDCNGSTAADDDDRLVIIFGVMNFGSENQCILIPKICLSVPLICEIQQVGRVEPSTPIRIRPGVFRPPVFQLNSINHSNRTARDDLDRHGMQLVTLYL